MKILIIITAFILGFCANAKRYTEDTLEIGKKGSSDNKEFFLGPLGGIRSNESLNIIEQTLDGLNWTEVGSGSFNSPLDTKGDILVYTTENAKKGAQNDGEFLQYDSAQPDNFLQVSLDIPQNENLVLNSSFDSDLSDWNLTNSPTWDPSGKARIFDSGGPTPNEIWQLLILDTSKEYTLTFTVSSYVGSGNFSVKENTIGGSLMFPFASITGNGNYSATFTPTVTNTVLQAVTNASGDYLIDDIELRESKVIQDTPIKSDNKTIKRIVFDLNDYNDGDTLPLIDDTNLVQDPGFDQGNTFWTDVSSGTASATISTGVILLDYPSSGNVAAASQPITLEQNTDYIWGFDIVATTGADSFPGLALTSDPNDTAYIASSGIFQPGSPIGSYTNTFNSGSNTNVFLKPLLGGVAFFTATHDNYFLRKVLKAGSIVELYGDYKTASGNFMADNSNGVFINSSGQLEIEKTATTASGGLMIVEYIEE